VLAEIVGWEILVPLALIALLFGGSRIPELARSLGRAKHEFEKAHNEDEPSSPNDDDDRTS
jgi:sec-independent protein translocase protein TatA